MIRFLYSCTIVWGIICVIMYLIEGINPGKIWIFSISSLFIPVSFIINFFLIAFWLIVHWRYTWLPAVVILGGSFQLFKLISFNSISEMKACRSNNAVDLMSFNIYGLKNLKDSSSSALERNKSLFLSFLRRTDPDILCVQENNLFSDNVINHSQLYTYVHYLINHGAAIYSKYPILDQGKIDFGTNTNSCLWCDILIEGHRVRVYSTHLQSNSITKNVEQLKDDREEENIEKINVVKLMLRKYRRMSIRRANQADMVQKHAEQSPYPVILAGDLNDTPFSYVYRRLSEGKKDSFLERGFGFGSTLVGLIPGLRIDYIFCDTKKFEFCSHKVLQTEYSDHNPIMSRIVLK
ncbi:MAG: endonuclease/exonuclease/phosphatase family protein [Saprospiraceae bacterium]|nr:endonuclease/exonuclease/phosphatase family protein [Saprospiraceae bacterium]